MKLTELEKTILLVFLVFTKSSLDRYLTEEFITSKFTMRQRKMVRISLKRLRKEGLIIKHPRERYKFSKTGLKRASSILHEGAKLWKIR